MTAAAIAVDYSRGLYIRCEVFTGADTGGHRARTGRLRVVKMLIFAMQQKEAKINFQSTAVVCPLLLSVLFEGRHTASAIAAIAGVTQSKAPSMASATTTANSCRYSSKLASEDIN